MVINETEEAVSPERLIKLLDRVSIRPRIDYDFMILKAEIASIRLNRMIEKYAGYTTPKRNAVFPD